MTWGALRGHGRSGMPAGGEIAREVVLADPDQLAEAMHRQLTTVDQATNMPR